MFRNPLYLNVPLLRNVADYHGIDLPGDREVTRRRRDESRRRAGVAKYVEVGKEGEAEDEITEKYSTQFRPVRALNDVVDHLERERDVIEVSNHQDNDVALRSLVQAEGLIEMSPLTEVAALMAALLPPVIEQAAAGNESPDLDPAVIGKVFLGGAPQNIVHVLSMEVGEHRFLIMAHSDHIFGDAAMDDLEDELTVLAWVDRVVPRGESKSLERYVMPNVNRTIRRMLRGRDLEDMLESFGEALGQSVDRNSLVIEGPAAILTPIAIY